jgi:malonate transporter and related proteins
MQILNIVLPIFILIFLGYLLRKKDIVKDSWVHALNGYVYFVALPAVVFVSFWEINWQAPAMWQKLFLGLILLLVFALALAIILKLFSLSKKTFVAVFMSLLVGNTVYLGFPLANSAFGKENFGLVTVTASVFLVFGIILSILTAELVLIKAKRTEVYLKHFLLNPLMLSLLFGFVFGLINLHHPILEIFKKSISMLGATASPVALFALGCFLSGKFVFSHFKTALFTSLGKILILPLFFFFGLKFFNLSLTEQNIYILLAGMPTAVTTFVIAEEYRLDESLVANVILISTLLSILTLSGFLYIF